MENKKELLIRLFFLCNGSLAIIVLAGIFYLLLSNSLAAWREVGVLPFFTGIVWRPSGFESVSFGILTLVTGTLLVTAGAAALAIPLGIACAVYLAEVASPLERELVKPVVELLAGVPSVVIGFFGLVVLNPLLAGLFNIPNGLTALNGALLLALMSLPTIISISEDALTAVPREYKEASLALGANRWQTVIRVILPAAFSGVSAAVMLGIGRAIGETMTVVMATGNALRFPDGFLSSIRTMTATLAIEMGEVPFNSTHYFALFAVGFVLFAMTFFLSLLADLFLHKAGKVAKR
jgi:phosphate transport system permease protein